MSLDIGVGVDIEDIERFRGLKRSKDGAFLVKIFTERELDYCFSKEDAGPHLAARYAGKEAVIKVLAGLNVKGVGFREIEIARGRGAPKVRLKGIYQIKVSLSLSHCDDKAVALAVAIEE